MIWRFPYCISTRQGQLTGFPVSGCPPGPSQRPGGFKAGPVGHPQGNVDPGLAHLGLRLPQEAVGGHLVLEDHQDLGREAVVVGGPAGGVVAQVGGQADGHGAGPHGAALPLQEEGPGHGAAPQQAEGVGVDRARTALETEVAGGPVGRVQLRHLPPQGAGLDRQRRQESVDGGGVVQVAEQLPGPAAGDVAPVEGLVLLQGRDAPPLSRRANGGAVAAGQQGQPPVGDGQPPARSPRPGRKTVAFQGYRQLGSAGSRHAQHRRQFPSGQPGPVGHQVQGQFLGGPQHCGQRASALILVAGQFSL